MTTPDPQKFRVTRICRCSADYAEGYGATLDQARAAVRRFWRRGGHRERDVAEEIVECVSPDGSRYVPAEVSS